jgi:protein-disulfide isomerase
MHKLMSNNPPRIGEWLMRRLILCVLLLTVGCRAAAPAKANADLDHRVSKLVLATFKLPPWVSVKVEGRTPSKEFPGFDKLSVVLSSGNQTQTREMLLSKDGKTLYTMTKMDLTRDPQAETMAKIDLQGRPVRGNKDAKVTVVVFDDFQCPYCSRMHQTIRDVLKTYGDRIKVVYKNFPLTQIHPWAKRAAIDSDCLARQSSDAFWDFADNVHSHGREIQGGKRPVKEQHAAVDRIALEAGKRHNADMAALQSCIDEQPTAELDKSVAEAKALGVEATPSLFVNGLKMDGAVPEEQFRIVLDKELQ